MLADMLREVEKIEEKYKILNKKAYEEGEANAISYQRDGLLETLSARFGEIPIDWQNAIAKLNDPKKIFDLTVAMFKVSSAEEYGKLLTNTATS